MNATDLLHEIHAEGIQLALTERGTIKIAGEQTALDKWTPVIRQHKPALIDLLRGWGKLAAAINACCDIRKDTDENRAALLSDAWGEPADAWPWFTDYFMSEDARWTH